MVVDFILLLIEGALAFLEQLFLHKSSRKGKVRKSLEHRRAQRSEHAEG